MNYTLFRSVRTLLFCLILNSLHGQSTSISDSLLTKNPLWSGDTAWMSFTSSGLRTNAPGAGSLHWSLPSNAAVNAQWRLNIALPAPFTLANDSLTLELITAPGQILDRMTYYPLDAPHDHQSFERISWHTSGDVQANWHPHLASLLASTEASPNQPNSVAGALPTLLLEASIIPNFIDLSPNSMAGGGTGSGSSNSSGSGAGSGAGSGSSAGTGAGATGTGPNATLWLHAERGDRLYVSLLDRTGRLLHPLVDGQVLPAAKKGGYSFCFGPAELGRRILTLRDLLGTMPIRRAARDAKKNSAVINLQSVIFAHGKAGFDCGFRPQ